MEETFFTYKGLPLVRKDDLIYYGNMSDKCVAMLKIESTRKVKDLDVANKVKVKFLLTAKDVDASKMVVKEIERGGLYDALTAAYIWLDRENKR